MSEILAAPDAAGRRLSRQSRPNVRPCFWEPSPGWGRRRCWPPLIGRPWPPWPPLSGPSCSPWPPFASVRSANRCGPRLPEAAFQANLRPVLVTSRIQDPMQKIRWVDDHWAHLDGGPGRLAEVEDGSIYLAISLRNVGTKASPYPWMVGLSPEAGPNRQVRHEDPTRFGVQTHDLFYCFRATWGSGRPRSVSPMTRTTTG